MAELLLLLQNVWSLSHLILLLLKLLEVHLLFLLAQITPCSLLLLRHSSQPWALSILARILLFQSIFLHVLHSHLLHLLLHDKVFLVLFQKHQMLVLIFILLIGSDFGIQNVLLVSLLKGVALHDLLLFGRETIHHMGWGFGTSVVVEHNSWIRVAWLGVVLIKNVLMMLLVHVWWWRMQHLLSGLPKWVSFLL